MSKMKTKTKSIKSAKPKRRPPCEIVVTVHGPQGCGKSLVALMIGASLGYKIVEEFDLNAPGAKVKGGHIYVIQRSSK